GTVSAPACVSRSVVVSERETQAGQQHGEAMPAHGPIALVTGAGSGIGRASTLALLREGWSVVLVGRRREVLERTIAEADTDQTRALAIPADVTDPAAVRALFQSTKEAF